MGDANVREECVVRWRNVDELVWCWSSEWFVRNWLGSRGTIVVILGAIVAVVGRSVVHVGERSLEE